MSITAVPAPSIAIIGSGPSGCFSAQFLRKKFKSSEIVIFDRLAEPYGLVRYGVAPDHLGTKAVAKQFDRLFEREGVTFVGNTEIGTGPTRDGLTGGGLTLAQLHAAFDIVILATGLSADRPLGGEAAALEGANLVGVFGAGAITRLINGHPEESVESLQLGHTVTIVGHGNVALDLVRLFLTPAAQLRALGVADDVIAALEPVRCIEIVGRSHTPGAKFDVAMAKELSALPDVQFLADAQLPPDALHNPAPMDARGTAIAELVAGSPAAASRSVHFRFGWSPVRVMGTDRVTEITFGAGRARLTLATNSVCTAIGFSEHADAPLRRGDHETAFTDLARGLLDTGLFCVGWLRRGPQGTIPANRVDARMVVDEIIAAVESGALATGKPGFRSLSLPTLIQEFS